MSRVVVVEKNKDGKIELTKDELQKMLDDAYNQGYSDGRSKLYDTITYPSTTPVLYTTTNEDRKFVNKPEITCTAESVLNSINDTIRSAMYEGVDGKLYSRDWSVEK